eukprot:467343-Prymnesium_polylepis.2
MAVKQTLADCFRPLRTEDANHNRTLLPCAGRLVTQCAVRCDIVGIGIGSGKYTSPAWASRRLLIPSAEAPSRRRVTSPPAPQRTLLFWICATSSRGHFGDCTRPAYTCACVRARACSCTCCFTRNRVLPSPPFQD